MNDQNIWMLDQKERYRQERRVQAVKLLLKSASMDLILDVGCGEGFITSRLIKAGFIVGLDISKNSLLIAKQKVNQSNVDFICADVASLPLRTASFKKVSLLEVLEHLPNPVLKEGIKEVDRVLKLGGILLISVPYKEKITYSRCIHCGKLTPIWGHLQSFDENKLASLIPKNYEVLEKKHLPNLGLISCSKIFRWMPLRIWLLMNDLLGIIRKGYWILLSMRKRDSFGRVLLPLD